MMNCDLYSTQQWRKYPVKSSVRVLDEFLIKMIAITAYLI